jgi:hypothetical protein
LTLIGLVALTALALHAVSGDAEPGRRPGLKKQVAELRAELAQVSNQVNFAARAIADIPTFPGGSLCGDPCATDSDEDGIGDCEDYCPCDPNTTDTDADGIPDCADPCPDDATDACIDPCNQDADGDGVKDCEDPCPWDPAAPADDDEDGIPDCQDFCPGDRYNTCFEPCTLDTDGDGTSDCDDGCPWEPDTGAGGPTAGCVPPDRTR